MDHKVIGTWKAAACFNPDGKQHGRKFPFRFDLKENGMGVMRFLCVPYECTWKCNGKAVNVYVKEKEIQLKMAGGQLVMEGDNHSKAFFRKAA